MKPSPRSGLGLFVGLIAMASACSNDDSLSASEAQFDDAFIQPLEAAGLNYSVEEVCHYARTNPDEPWHFQIRVEVDADPDEVANVLASTVDIIERDRDPMTLQHYAGEPSRGWNGVLESDGEGAALSVVKNNVDLGGDLPSVGWLPVCAFQQ